MKRAPYTVNILSDRDGRLLGRLTVRPGFVDDGDLALVNARGRRLVGHVRYESGGVRLERLAGLAVLRFGAGEYVIEGEVEFESVSAAELPRKPRRPRIPANPWKELGAEWQQFIAGMEG